MKTSAKGHLALRNPLLLYTAGRRTPPSGATAPGALQALARDHGVTLVACDASDPGSVTSLFDEVGRRLGPPGLVVHNIDGRPREVFRKSITEVDAEAVLATLMNSTFSAFLVGRQAARAMLESTGRDGHKGTILFTNVQSMARELMPRGIHVAYVPIDAAIGWEQPDGSRAHRLAGQTADDNMAHPDRIAEVYLQLHRSNSASPPGTTGRLPLVPV